MQPDGSAQAADAATADAATAAAAGGRTRTAVIDCDVHSKIPNDVLLRYLPARWSDYFRDYGYRWPNEIAYFSTRPRGGGAARTDAFPPSGAPPAATRSSRGCSCWTSGTWSWRSSTRSTSSSSATFPASSRPASAAP